MLLRWLLTKQYTPLKRPHNCGTKQYIPLRTPKTKSSIYHSERPIRHRIIANTLKDKDTRTVKKPVTEQCLTSKGKRQRHRKYTPLTRTNQTQNKGQGNKNSQKPSHRTVPNIQRKKTKTQKVHTTPNA